VTDDALSSGGASLTDDEVPHGRELRRQARRVRRLLRVGTGPVDLAQVDPRSTPGLPGRKRTGATTSERKAWSHGQLGYLATELAELQERLYAAAKAGTDRRRLLLVLQAMDCGGKDGTVKSVVGALNPEGVRITAFGVPTPEELAHDFLWRIHRAAPGAGFVGVFNRSHYEDVLAGRVRALVPRRTWRDRYDQINAFEDGQAADGVTLIKVMLHISYDEQRKRLLARLDDPTKRWKFNPSDLDDRARWADFQQAYADVISRCSSPANPWYVVPADRKWYRNWAVAHLMLAHLDALAPTYPDVALDVAGLRQRLAEQAPE
jgi:PPK2 family polyphosphate:nucleotide phosphotransferase